MVPSARQHETRKPTLVLGSQNKQVGYKVAKLVSVLGDTVREGLLETGI